MALVGSDSSSSHTICLPLLMHFAFWISQHITPGFVCIQGFISILGKFVCIWFINIIIFWIWASFLRLPFVKTEILPKQKLSLLCSACMKTSCLTATNKLPIAWANVQTFFCWIFYSTFTYPNNRNPCDPHSSTHPHVLSEIHCGLSFEA